MSDYHYCRWRDLPPLFPPPTARKADPPDPAAELAEALREIAKQWPDSFAARRARTALAKYEASK